jgi:hypothetical protein
MPTMVEELIRFFFLKGSNAIFQHESTGYFDFMPGIGMR